MPLPRMTPSLQKARRQVRTMLHTRGYELPKRPRVPGTLYPCLRRIAERFEPRSVIDVGVAWGTPGLLRAFPEARFLLVEPLVEFEPALSSICRRYSASYVLTAASSTPGRTDIAVAADLSSSSPLGPSGMPVLETRTVRASRIDTLAGEHRLEAPFVLKIDVQGGELDVLESSTGILDDTELVILEATLFELWESSPQFDAIVEAMSARGFMLYDMFGGDRRPLDGALAQLDLVFAARNGSLRADHRYRAGC